MAVRDSTGRTSRAAVPVTSHDFVLGLRPADGDHEEKHADSALDIAAGRLSEARAVLQAIIGISSIDDSLTEDTVSEIAAAVETLIVIAQDAVNHAIAEYVQGSITAAEVSA